MPVTGTFLGYPFDQELFRQMWTEVPDPRLTAMLESGAMVPDAAIASQIANDGNFYTIPFYNILDGEEQNYDGMTDITLTETTGTSQSGIVYGRAKAFSARNFQAELSGADPMGHIIATVARYWQNREQKRFIKMLDGVFATTDTSDFATLFKQTHILDTGGTPVQETTANRLMTRSLGDNKSMYSMAIMHSIVAERLENLQVLSFWTQTLASGIQRPLPLASWNGLTVIVDDSVPVDMTDPTKPKYTTYLFGQGAIRRAEARLDVPAEPGRDGLKFGGLDYLITRIRRTMHPNGFSYIVPTTGWTQSPTDAQLSSGDRWKLIFNPKAVAIAKLISTEGAAA